MTGKTAADAKAEVLEHERPERRPDMDAPDLSDLEVADDPHRAGGPPARPSARSRCRPSRSAATEDELLACSQSFKERKLMRRFAAVMNHRSAGFKANAMGVWAVPEDELGEIGPQMAGLRRGEPLLPAAHLRGLAVHRVHDGARPQRARLRGRPSPRSSDETGVDEYALLWSIKEYKKTRVKYFTPDWDAWIDAHRLSAPATS